MIKDEFYVLTNGVKIPKIGLGTWQSSNDDALSTITDLAGKFLN